jgi:hypothetical protein
MCRVVVRSQLSLLHVPPPINNEEHASQQAITSYKLQAHGDIRLSRGPATPQSYAYVPHC